MPRRDGLSLLNDEALLSVSGMGGFLAAAAARRLVEAGVSALLSFGLAGGLDPALRAGMVVLPAEIISRSGVRLSTSAVWRGQILAALAPHLTPVGGALLTSAAPLDAASDKAAAFHETGAVAVDMESLDVAKVAAAHGLPFMAVRAIVDTAADSLPRSVLTANRAGQVSVRHLLGGLAGAPFEMVALLRLAQRYRAATRSLAAAARAGVLTPLAVGARVA